MKTNPVVHEIQNFGCQLHNSDIYVNDIQTHLKQYDFVLRPHRHNFYLMAFFTGGTGTHEIDFCCFKVTRGSIFVMQPGQMHSWVLSDDVSGYVIFFTREVYNLYFGKKRIEEFPFFQTSQSIPEIILNEQEIMKITSYFVLMMDEYKNHLSFQNDIILNLLDTVHIDLSRKYNFENTHITYLANNQIKQFENLLEQYYKTEKSPNFYADKMAITAKHLNRIAKNILNTTISQLITNRIILESKRMMLDRSSTVNEIANELGYENYSYFSRFFKKNTGMSMTEFIKSTNRKYI